MFCTFCGKEKPDDAPFCPYCGQADPVQQLRAMQQSEQVGQTDQTSMMRETQMTTTPRRYNSSQVALLCAFAIVVIFFVGLVVILENGSISGWGDKNDRGDDLASAESIYTAISAALSCEDAYEEVSNSMNGAPLASAKPGEAFYSLSDSRGYVTFLNELNSSLGGMAPDIKYTDEGACYWTIAIDISGRPIVYVAASEGGTTWELQPMIDDKYK